MTPENGVQMKGLDEVVRLIVKNLLIVVGVAAVVGIGIGLYLLFC